MSSNLLTIGKSWLGVVPQAVHKLPHGKGKLVLSLGSAVHFEGDCIVNAANEGCLGTYPPPSPSPSVVPAVALLYHPLLARAMHGVCLRDQMHLTSFLSFRAWGAAPQTSSSAESFRVVSFLLQTNPIRSRPTGQAAAASTAPSPRRAVTRCTAPGSRFYPSATAT